MINTIKRLLGMDDSVGLSQESETLGSICYWAGFPGRVPMNFMPCDGRRLSIRDNAALYSILGNQWGGDPQHDFALPDLRVRNAKGEVDPANPWAGKPVPLICVRGLYPMFD